jgi:hypothetical protein
MLRSSRDYEWRKIRRRLAFLPAEMINDAVLENDQYYSKVKQKL